MTTLEADPGSFRDPRGLVFVREGRVFRTITRHGHDDFKAVEETGLLADLIARDLLVSYRDVEKSELGQPGDNIMRVLEHPPLPFISYPFEWSFGLLKAAALMHLEVQLTALERGVTLSDSSAFNVQFLGVRPIFIDHLSFRPYRDGEFWSGHRQFCDQFLNPLLLQSQVGVSFNAWYRGNPEGIPAESLAPMLPWISRLKLQVMTNVILPAWFARRSRSNSQISTSLAGKRLPLSGYRNMLTGLRQFIASLELPQRRTTWKEYAATNTYASEEAEHKRAFIREFSATVKPGVIWDMGCNTGEYSRAALDGGSGMAVGFEFDAGALGLAYARAREEKLNFLPLYMDAANPTPSQGWNQAERSGLAERRNADAVVALAFVHHLAIARNVPLHFVVGWLIGLAPQGVIEFVPKSDPMVRELLSLREDIFDEYTDAAFDGALARHAEVVREETITGTGRRLVWFKRR